MFKTLIALQPAADGGLIITSAREYFFLDHDVRRDDERFPTSFTYRAKISYDEFSSRLKSIIGNVDTLLAAVVQAQEPRQMDARKRKKLLELCVDTIPEDQYENYEPILIESIS